MTRDAITDHALLRWLERVHGIDVDGFRQRLHDESKPYLDAGAKAWTRGGATYIARGGRLVTVKTGREMKVR